MGNSYLKYRLFGFFNLSLDLDVQTFVTEGLIFYYHLDSVYMALYLEDGRLKFKFSCGYQTMLLSELVLPVNNGYILKLGAG